MNDPVTCTSQGAATPCTVTVLKTTLETPPNQAIGGGYNSTLSSGTITTGTPLPNGQSILLSFKLGVQKTDTFRFTSLLKRCRRSYYIKLRVAWGENSEPLSPRRKPLGVPARAALADFLRVVLSNKRAMHSGSKRSASSTSTSTSASKRCRKAVPVRHLVLE